MRRFGLATAFMLVATSVGGSAAIARDGAPSAVTANIVGTQTAVANESYTATYRFPSQAIRVAQGGTITFLNKTDDFHTISLVTQADLPMMLHRERKVNAGNLFNDCVVCNAVNNAYGLGGNGPPNGFQLDGGQLSDDDAQADADAPDTGAMASATGLPPGSPPVLIADFDTASSGGATPTVGDSTIIAPPGSGFFTQRTVRMTAAPGTYFYACTLHPWMEGSIVVEAAT